MISKSIYWEEGVAGADVAEPLMEKIDIIQRRYLYSVPTPAITVINQGGMAFSVPAKRGLYSHFGQLTDVSILIKSQEGQ